MEKTCNIHTAFLNRQLNGGFCPATKHITLIPSIKRRIGSSQTVSSLVTRKTMNTRTLIDRRVPSEVPMPEKFGMFGGKFVPETLITSLNRLEAEFIYALQDPEFQEDLATAMRDYVGRETPLYFAQGLTDYYKNKDGEGAEIYLKREDLNHCGAHKMNNAVAQAMIAKRMGPEECCGSHWLKPVEGGFKEASSEAIREWAGKLETSYYLTGTAVGPHPCPSMVCEFQSVIGKETRRQAMEKWGGKPDVLIACIGSGSNAMGLFHEFIEDEEVKLIGVEAAGFGLDSGKHAATLSKGEVGVYHGAMSYLLEDEEGQIIRPHSIAVGQQICNCNGIFDVELEYPGVSPQLSFLKDTERAEFHSSTDKEAVDAYLRLCRLEGIIPSLEASHALAYLEKICPALPNGTKVILNCSGRGDKDAGMVHNQKFCLN
ncbi:hypothetical protein OIU76_026021 [Salix suchowensis]|nr:hypothetical protein OIU76_026021 [Salix suchowensis]